MTAKTYSAVNVHLLTTRDLGKLFLVAPRTIRQWRMRGALHAIKIGRELRFRSDEVEALVGVPLSREARESKA